VGPDPLVAVRGGIDLFLVTQHQISKASCHVRRVPRSHLIEHSYRGNSDVPKNWGTDHNRGAKPSVQRNELQALPGNQQESQPTTSLASLTRREREIASIAGMGKRTREIAEVLSVSPRTVDVHLTRIYRKLNIRSRAALARLMAEVERTLE
jgi:DNA-binding CsgD family transcriptional regulator